MSKKEFQRSAGIRTMYGRYAGAGVYGFNPWDEDEAETGMRDANIGCSLPHDAVVRHREEWEKLNGPVIIVKEGKKNG